MVDPDESVVPGAGLEAAFRAAARLVGPRAGSEMETASLIAVAAVESVPGAEQAGISLLHSDGSITSHPESENAIGEVDQLQATFREGPCVTALWDQHTVLVDDLAAEVERWPRFAPKASAAGIGSMLSFQLYARENTLGALNLYSQEPRSFTADSRTLGELFAVQAAAALGEARHVAQLHQALETRDVIGKATGILMERYSADADRAFSMLVRTSQETNMKLVAVARWLTSKTSRREAHD